MDLSGDQLIGGTALLADRQVRGLARRGMIGHGFGRANPIATPCCGWLLSEAPRLGHWINHGGQLPGRSGTQAPALRNNSAGADTDSAASAGLMIEK
jgi:hypothetical protein